MHGHEKWNQRLMEATKQAMSESETDNTCMGLRRKAETVGYDTEEAEKFMEVVREWVANRTKEIMNGG